MLMNKLFILILFVFSIFYGQDSLELLNIIIADDDIVWTQMNEINNKNIYEGKIKANETLKLIRIEKKVPFDKQEIFSVIMNFNEYNNIISNDNIVSHYVYSKSDTVYGHQLISNMIPFIRNRQYILKMFVSESNILSWVLIDSVHQSLEEYLDDDINTLSYGAGTWEIKEDNILVKKIYVDDKVKLPFIFIQKIRVNNVVNIFDDILYHLNKLDRKEK